MAPIKSYAPVKRAPLSPSGVGNKAGLLSKLTRVARFVGQRPSDGTIRGIRVLFGVVLAGVLAYHFEHFTVWVGSALASSEVYFRYGLFVFALIPIIIGAVNLCIAKRKIFRILEMVFGLVLIVVANVCIVDTPVAIAPVVPVATVPSGSYDAAIAVNKTAPSAPQSSHTAFWVALLGILPILGGASGKMITSGCMKYGEKIIKIRV